MDVRETMGVCETPSTWHKSSASQNGDCVEWGYTKTRVYVRDSKNPSQSPLGFTYSEWWSFIAGIKLGEADLDIKDA